MPNSVYGYILGPQCVAYFFQATVAMTSGFNSRKIVCRACLVYVFSKEFQIVFVCLFDLILNVPSTIFQLNRDGSSWVEPVLS